MTDPSATLSTSLPEDAVAAALAERFGAPPELAVVLGSGAGPVGEAVEAEAPPVPYAALGLPSTSVAGHGGVLTVGRLGRARVAVLAGRAHLYEHLALEPVVRGVRAMARWGVPTLVLTSAVGACRPELAPGTLVCLRDHINMTGRNAIAGPPQPRRGPRFPDMGTAYTPALAARLVASAAALGVPLERGVYGCMLGPSYETPAEVRMLRMLGADVVGMSTVHEVVAARQMGMDVLALATVSNLGAGLSETPLSHEEVGEVVGAASANIARLLRHAFGR